MDTINKVHGGAASVHRIKPGALHGLLDGVSVVEARPEPGVVSKPEAGPRDLLPTWLTVDDATTAYVAAMELAGWTEMEVDPVASAPAPHWRDQYKRPGRRPVVVVAKGSGHDVVPSFTQEDLHRMSWGALAGTPDL